MLLCVYLFLYIMSFRMIWPLYILQLIKIQNYDNGINKNHERIFNLYRFHLHVILSNNSNAGGDYRLGNRKA